MVAAGVLARVAVPSPLSTNVTPVGSAGLAQRRVGVPVVVTVNGASRAGREAGGGRRW